LEVSGNGITEITVNILAGTEVVVLTYPSEDSTAGDFQGYAAFVKGSSGSPLNNKFSYYTV